MSQAAQPLAIKPHTIKRGVSLYSFQEEYFLGKLDLQGCLRTLHDLGIPGVEVIGEQMFNGFPNLSPRQIADWRQWLSDYGLTPTCHDMFLDTKRYKHRPLALEESVDSMVRDIRFAAALGCPRLRVIVITPPEVVEAAVRYAERYDVRLLLEIHSPWNFRHEWIQKHIEVIDRVGSPYLGLMPDLGIFVRRFPRVITDRYLRDGATPKLVEQIIAAYQQSDQISKLPNEIQAAGGNAKDIQLANMVGHFCDIPPKEMLDYMPMIQHVQAKFYEMLPDDTEYSIPYDEIVAVLIEGGYDGWLSSEYEGNRHIQDAFVVDSVEQVRRHHQMLKRLLGEPAASLEDIANV